MPMRGLGKMEATLNAIMINHGQNRYRVFAVGKWEVLMWGWWPDSGDAPSYRWRPISVEKVPKAVRQKDLFKDSRVT